MTDAAGTGPGRVPVARLVEDDVARVPASATLVEVAERLTAREVGALAVGEGDDISGIVSERDLVHAIARGADPAATRAGDIAQAELIWCDHTATVAEVAEVMMEKYVRHVLLEDGGRMVGIVSARDLLGYYAADDMD